MRERIANAKGFIFDMDGTLALGDAASGGHVALPGAVDLLARIKRSGIPVRVLTNGTAKRPAAYAASLRAAGFDLADEEMITPSTSAAVWLTARGIRRVRVLGDPGTAAPLADAGIEVIAPSTPADGVEAVYSGWFRVFCFRDLEAAVRDIWAGARAVTASHVPFFATQEGRGLGSSFPMNVVLRAWTGKLPKILGKPSRECFFTALKLMGLPRSAAADVVVVGDDPKLEMRMANAVGAISVGVATGLTGLKEMEALGPAERPQLALASVADLLD
jgi:NagD protein